MPFKAAGKPVVKVGTKVGIILPITWSVITFKEVWQGQKLISNITFRPNCTCFDPNKT